MRAKVRYNARMNKSLKITRIGNSAGIVLPKELLAHLDAEDAEDQMVVAREVMQNRHRAMMELAERIMEEDRNILAALAKS
jgi:antitoxin component of MazEF toxin-antitoxin module